MLFQETKMSGAEVAVCRLPLSPIYTADADATDRTIELSRVGGVVGIIYTMTLVDVL